MSFFWAEEVNKDYNEMSQQLFSVHEGKENCIKHRRVERVEELFILSQWKEKQATHH